MSCCRNETSWFARCFFPFPFSSISLIEPNGSRSGDLYKKLPCLVCGASASGIHFGAVTCEACKVREAFETKTERKIYHLKNKGLFPSISQRKCTRKIPLFGKQ